MGRIMCQALKRLWCSLLGNGKLSGCSVKAKHFPCVTSKETYLSIMLKFCPACLFFVRYSVALYLYCIQFILCMILSKKFMPRSWAFIMSSRTRNIRLQQCLTQVGTPSPKKFYHTTQPGDRKHTHTQSCYILIKHYWCNNTRILFFVAFIIPDMVFG